MPSVKIEKQQLDGCYRKNSLEDSSWNPTRNVFYVDVSDLSFKEAWLFMNGVEATLKAIKESTNT